jgi:hypothetical protein
MLRLLLVLLLLCGSVQAADLAWNASAVNQACCDAGDCTGCDGCCQPDGYRIHWGSSSGVYTGQNDAGNNLTWHIPDDWFGSYYFAASAYNATGQSGYSNEVLFTRSQPQEYIGATGLRASRYQSTQGADMGWSYIGGSQGTGSGSAGTIDTSGSLTVAAGDLLVAVVKFDGADTTVTVADTGGSNGFTQLDKQSTAQATTWVGYKIGASASTAAIRATLGANRAYRYIAVMQFRPDSGDVVTLADADFTNNGYTGSSHTSSTGVVSATGDDLCAVAVIGNYATNLSSQAIGNAAATAVVESDGGYGAIWYKLYTTDVSNIDADCSVSGSDYEIMALMVFKSEAGGASVVPVLMRTYRAKRQ